MAHWLATPHLLPTFPTHQLLLRLLPPSDEVAYQAEVSWTETVGGSTQRTRLNQPFVLHGVPHGPHWHLTLCAQPPRLREAGSSSFDEVTLILAELYASLVLEVAPTGELLGLANLPEIRQTWQTIKATVARKYEAASEMLDILVRNTDYHLARPDGLLESLRYNYLHAALLGTWYQQPFEAGRLYTQPKAFPEFFAGHDLCFTQALRLAPTPSPEYAVLELTGTSDRQLTPLDAIAEHIRATLGRPLDSVKPDDLQLTYTATHRLRHSTGLPAAVELTVRCAYFDLYYKEYYLTIEQTS